MDQNKSLDGDIECRFVCDEKESVEMCINSSNIVIGLRTGVKRGAYFVFRASTLAKGRARLTPVSMAEMSLELESSTSMKPAAPIVSFPFASFLFPLTTTRPFLSFWT